MREMMRGYLKEHDIRIKDGTDVNAVMRDMMSVLLESVLDEELNEELGYFSYRIIFFVNENGKGTKHYTDTSYSGLRRSLENIIRSNLSLTNSIVIAETTALKGGKCVCLQSRPYSFSLDGYFKQISGEYADRNKRGNILYGRYAVR